MDDIKVLKYDYKRRFGVEIETNSLDGRDFINFPLDKHELPEGIDYIGELISKKLKTSVSLHNWHYTNNNNNWVLKPDRSCGLEICSPVSKGKYGMDQICQVIDVINEDPMINIDGRCSFHVHVNLNDCKKTDINAILAWWIKCEAVFIDSLPVSRKNTRYCQCIGASDLFYDDFKDYEYLNLELGEHKYYTVNTYHMNKKRRNSIEFRILGNEGCLDSLIAKNWIRLLIHFVERAKERGLPRLWSNKGTSWRGLLWIDPIDVFEFLGFIGCELSEDMIEIRDWFLKRLKKNITTNLVGFWSRAARAKAIEEVDELISIIGLNI
jgi:hypothetical protein